MALIRVDGEGNALRDELGMAIKCKPGEVGEIVAQNMKDCHLAPFDGYINKEATAKKLIENVFEAGDVSFRSGDLLTMDQEGFLYFHDRTGDTYRWKGENVSTNEVEGSISRFLNQQDVVSYGVEIPGTEGRAGMVCIADPNREVDVQALYKDLLNQLPAYALPVFIRITGAVEKTGTYKFQKTVIRSQGFDISQCGADEVYYVERNVVKKLDEEAFQSITARKIRF